MLKQKSFSIAIIVVLFLFIMMIWPLNAQPYVWESNPINVPTSEPYDFYYMPPHFYDVEVAGNGRVWTCIYYSSHIEDRVILVYDPISEVIDTIGPEIMTTTGLDTLGTGRGLVKLSDGNIAFADWQNDKIKVFDADDYSLIKESLSGNIDCGGGMTAFVYGNEQYFLSQQIIGSTVILWDGDFNAIDTLRGGPGGRNLACTYDGNIIVSPSLGGQFFVEWVGNPDDGYVTDTIWLADLSVRIGNIMYVSLGPNDYFWLMSRDAENDGVLVVDPLDDYDVKMFTNTDSTDTSINENSLGMVVDNQVSIWLLTGVIDSSEFDTIWNSYMLRAPCAVACDLDGYKEYLYVADYYCSSIKLFTRTQTSVWEYEYSIDFNKFILNNAYPNPFNPTTNISYAIPEASDVMLSIYDISGHLVETLVDKYHQAGQYSVKWNASKYSSGIYISRLESSFGTHSRKMLLIK